ncbi:MAG: sulfatase, partial [Natronomonas sp.]
MPTTSEHPNVIFYVSDSLRADHLSCYGYGRETTPNIDRLAEDGIRFERMFAQAYKTVESSVSILTGLYPPAHRARTTYDVVPDEAPRIAPRLSEAGYETGGISTLVQISERRNFDEGFETFEESFRTERADDGVTDWAAVCTERAIDWLESRDGGPFFLFLWSNGTHDPYSPRANVFAEEEPDHGIDGSLQSLRNAGPEQAAHVRDLYDDTIHHADAQFGRLLEYLERTGLYDETAIVFTADHGELLSEHGRLEHAYGPLRWGVQTFAPGLAQKQTMFEPGAFVGHLATLPYEELLHVPGIVKPAGGTYERGARGGLVETIDLMPTVADIADVTFETQGESLRPLFEGDRQRKGYTYSDTAISRGLTQTRSVRSSEYKFVRTDWAPSRLRDRKSLDLENTIFSALKRPMAKSELLFDLPDEDTNVRGERPEITTRLRAKLDEWLRNCTEFAIETDTSELD